MTNPADIVTRLRQRWLAHQDKDARFVQVNMQEWMRCTDLTREAATEIELLRAEHDALRAERDEVRQSYCSLMEAYRGGDGRITANKLGWGYLFEKENKENTND